MDLKDFEKGLKELDDLTENLSVKIYQVHQNVINALSSNPIPIVDIQMLQYEILKQVNPILTSKTLHD